MALYVVWILYTICIHVGSKTTTTAISRAHLGINILWAYGAYSLPICHHHYWHLPAPMFRLQSTHPPNSAISAGAFLSHWLLSGSHCKMSLCKSRPHILFRELREEEIPSRPIKPPRPPPHPLRVPFPRAFPKRERRAPERPSQSVGELRPADGDICLRRGGGTEARGSKETSSACSLVQCRPRPRGTRPTLGGVAVRDR